MTTATQAPPQFTIPGDPEAIRQAADRLRATGQRFDATGHALRRVSTDGWDGPAADDFADAFTHEPHRWDDAARGFTRAADALHAYAETIAAAQAEARDLARRWNDGEQVRRHNEQAWNAHEQATTQPGALPTPFSWFDDPGYRAQQQAEHTFSALQASVARAGDLAADQVRAGCAGAPAKRSWLGKAADHLGSLVVGIGEALWGLHQTLTPLMPMTPEGLYYYGKKLHHALTDPEEFAAEQQLTREQIAAVFTAARNDPAGFGTQVGKALLDWDTWADDPARALGHLVPDALATLATGGAGAGLRGLRGLDALADTADTLADLTRAGRGADGLDAAADLRHIDAPGEVDPRRVYDLADGSSHQTEASPERIGDLPAAREQLLDELKDHDLFHRYGVETPWTRDDLVEKINTPTSELSAADRAILVELRDRIPDPQPGEWMQKVLTPNAARAYLDNVVGERAAPNAMGGSVTRVGDTAHLDDPAGLHDGLRLDYDGTPFARGDESMMVMRFKAERGTFEVPRNSDMGGDPVHDVWGDPFTGNGFTKAAEDIVPEWQASRVRMDDGAEMWEVLSSGTQRLAAVLKEGQWIRVGMRSELP